MLIYKITNKINGHRYIGRTTTSLKQRWWSHKCSPLFAPLIEQYGAKNFIIEQIDTATTLDELRTKEHMWIAKLQPEYNRRRLNNYDRVLSWKVTEETERLLEKMYVQVFTERLNDKELPGRISKAAAFAELVQELAHVRGIQ